ncbi:MAG: Swarming motility protein ybiA [Oleiphilus sp.]|nr:MAG: Swarming motility protein ybiA [Oleiphilus sp.]
MSNEIEFWDHKDENGFLSNFYESKVFIGGRYWKTTEHYYQAMKHEGTDLYDQIWDQPTPKAAKAMARSVACSWTDRQKVKVMREAIKAKFTQNPLLRFALLGTGNARLVEASPTDSFWGYGKAGDGVNMMGLLLMELRAELASKA